MDKKQSCNLNVSGTQPLLIRFKYICTYIYIYIYIYTYRVSQEEGTKLRESVPYVKI